MRKKKTGTAAQRDSDSRSYYRHPKTTRTLREVSLDRARSEEEEPTPRVRRRRGKLPTARDDLRSGRENAQYYRAAKRMVLRGDTDEAVIRALKASWGLSHQSAMYELDRVKSGVERQHELTASRERRRRRQSAPEVTVVHSGRKFHVFVDGEDSGKFAYTRAKAEELAAKVRGPRRNPFDRDAEIAKLRRDALRADAPYGWAEASEAEAAKLSGGARDERELRTSGARETARERKIRTLRENADNLEALGPSFRARASELRAEARRLEEG
jgi:hypothetical protein